MYSFALRKLADFSYDCIWPFACMPIVMTKWGDRQKGNKLCDKMFYKVGTGSYFFIINLHEVGHQSTIPHGMWDINWLFFVRWDINKLFFGLVRTVRQIPRANALGIWLLVSHAPSFLGTTNPSRNGLNPLNIILEFVMICSIFLEIISYSATYKLHFEIRLLDYNLQYLMRIFK